MDDSDGNIRAKKRVSLTGDIMLCIMLELQLWGRGIRINVKANATRKNRVFFPYSSETSNFEPALESGNGLADLGQI